MQSELLEQAIEAFASLPGIGRKTALRLVLHLHQRPEEQVVKFSKAISKMRQLLKNCSQCGHLSDHEVCHICKDLSRQRDTICVVESPRDILAIEETGQYRGLYHVLGGVISPIDGVGPEHLSIDKLVQRVKESSVVELVMAVSPTIEGDTTIFYLSKQMEPHGVTISTIARGVAFGGELEYADEITLGRSILARVPYTDGESQRP